MAYKTEEKDIYIYISVTAKSALVCVYVDVCLYVCIKYSKI